MVNLTHDDGVGTTTSFEVRCPISIKFDEIVHITYIWDNTTSTIRGYENGIQVQTLTDSNFKWSTRTSGTNTRIGTSTQGGWGGFINGKLYNISVYNKALTPEEVLQNFNATKGRYGL